MEGNSLERYIEIYNSYFTAEKLKEKKGYVYCPVNGWDCPYWTKEGYCSLYPKEDPAEECDDFYSFWGTDKDYVCYD